MSIEIWNPISGYDGLYEVSNLGRVRSLDRYEKQKSGVIRPRKGRIMILLPKKTGYLSVRLSKNGRVRDISVHRLVAEAFLPNPNNLPCINHKDLNRKNNCVDNLEWCSYEYNNKYDNAREKAVITRCNPVEQYTLNGEFVARYRSARNAAKSIGLSPSGICLHLEGKQKTFGGYVLRYGKK